MVVSSFGGRPVAEMNPPKAGTCCLSVLLPLRQKVQIRYTFNPCSRAATLACDWLTVGNSISGPFLFEMWKGGNGGGASTLRVLSLDLDTDVELMCIGVWSDLSAS